MCVGAALFQMTVVLHNDVGELPAATTNKKYIPSPQWLVCLATMRKGEEEKRRKNNPTKGQKENLLADRTRTCNPLIAKLFNSNRSQVPYH